jgi:tetrahydromethanopterin S-methyltransferase subunit B
VAEAIAQQVPVVGDVETSTVTLPAGEAARIVYEWPIEDADGETTLVTVTQYAILADLSGNGFILSMSAASDRLAEYEDVFRQIAESFAEEPA